jgi:hypothetical protein
VNDVMDLILSIQMLININNVEMKSKSNRIIMIIIPFLSSFVQDISMLYIYEIYQGYQNIISTIFPYLFRIYFVDEEKYIKYKKYLNVLIEFSMLQHAWKNNFLS